MRNFLFIGILPLTLLAREWTVLVYMAADNALSAFADSDIVEMKNIGADENFAILVQVDKPDIGACRYYVGKDTLYNLGEMGLIDMCDWHTLQDFLVWGVMLFPARRYFLILWDHGTGWTLAPRRTFGSDWSAGSELSIARGDLRRALKGFYEITGKRLNLIGFDACNMQQSEILTELKDYARFCIAPQTVWPIAGFPYEHILYNFKINPKIDEQKLGMSIIEICRNYYSDQPSALSLVDLQNLNRLIATLKTNIDLLLKNPPDPGFKNIRNQVQTISLFNPEPHPEDDFIDLGDFLRLLNEYRATKETSELVTAYNTTVLKSEAWGAGLARVSGITAWFPDRYPEFKNLVDLYTLLSYRESHWPQFLNWFYGEDDIRPTTCILSASGPGRDNDFRLFWTPSFDLAPVFYNLVECNDTILIFYDNCEDSVHWFFNGFTLVSNFAYEGNGSFFSGNSSNLNNTLVTKNVFRIETLGLLDFYLFYNTEDRVDSFLVEWETKKAVFYGRSGSWQNIRMVLPPGNGPLRFYYRTNGSINNGGVYIDRIRLYNLASGRYVRYDLTDTALYVYNKLKGKYYYGVYPLDLYNNEGNLSNFVSLNIVDYAVPYSIPNPFLDNCEIILDYPDGIQPEVYIYSITGRLVKRFAGSEIVNKKIFWDGKDKKGKPVSAGLYFVLLKSNTINKIGKIARRQ
ncbi:MAG: clostripain-related cysteine peptidase [candidate division WOR-3 bacterium]